jgi:hypothetical protein
VETRKRPTAGALVFAADGLIAAFVLWVFLLGSGVNTAGWARIEQMVDYSAFRPFVTRALLPLIVRGANAVVPRLDRLAELPLLDGTLAAFFQNYAPGRERNVTQALLSFAAMWAFLVVGIRAMRRLLSAVDDGLSVAARSAWAWISPCLILVLMAGRGARNYGFVYDPATFGLFALALALIAEERWRAYVPVFLLAALNRETGSYLFPVFCLYGWSRLKRGRFAELATAQVVGFAAIRTVLEVFALDLGSMRQHHAAYVDFVPSLSEVPLVAATIGAIVCGLVGKHPYLLASAGMYPIAALGYFVGGSPGEYRAFIEVIPVAVTAVAVGARRQGLHERRITPRPSAAQPDATPRYQSIASGPTNT